MGPSSRILLCAWYHGCNRLCTSGTTGLKVMVHRAVHRGMDQTSRDNPALCSYAEQCLRAGCDGMTRTGH
jgi:hypothetical protein